MCFFEGFKPFQLPGGLNPFPCTNTLEPNLHLPSPPGIREAVICHWLQKHPQKKVPEGNQVPPRGCLDQRQGMWISLFLLRVLFLFSSFFFILTTLLRFESPQTPFSSGKKKTFWFWFLADLNAFDTSPLRKTRYSFCFFQTTTTATNTPITFAILCRNKNKKNK